MDRTSIKPGEIYYFENYSFLVFPTIETFGELVKYHAGRVYSAIEMNDQTLGNFVLGTNLAAKNLSHILSCDIEHVGIKETFMIVDKYETDKEFYIKIIGSNKMGWVNLSYLNDLMNLKHLPETQVHARFNSD